MCIKNYQLVNIYSSPCGRCTLFMETCNPIIINGYVCGGECDYDYCPYCGFYDDCPVYWGGLGHEST